MEISPSNRCELELLRRSNNRFAQRMQHLAFLNETVGKSGESGSGVGPYFAFTQRTDRALIAALFRFA